MLFKLSNLNSNFALTVGYLNPALNNSALAGKDTTTINGKRHAEKNVIKFTKYFFQLQGVE